MAVSALDQLKSQVAAGALTPGRRRGCPASSFKTAHVAFNELFEQGAAHSSVALLTPGREQQARRTWLASAGRAPLSQGGPAAAHGAGDHGVQATPVCDLVRISDPEWQRSSRPILSAIWEALLVSADHEKDAFASMVHHRAALLSMAPRSPLESRQTVSKQPDKGTVAAPIGNDHRRPSLTRSASSEPALCDSDKRLAGRQDAHQDG